MRALIILAVFLTGCSRQPEQTTGDLNSAAASETQAGVGVVCTGEGGTSDLSGRKPGPEKHETLWFKIDSDNSDLLKWDPELGSLVSICRGWGPGCYSEIFPKQVHTKAAKSSEENLELNLFRESGTLTIEEKHFDQLYVFAGVCKRGRLPSPKTDSNAV